VKPAAFAYDDPCSVAGALDLLAEHGDEAKVIAGGQSLVPLMNFRLARPARLIDVNRVDELAFIRRRSGSLRIGALTRMATLERSPLVAARWPLLKEAVRLVGHPQIRSRGTIGGSVAHSDPAAELPAALTALDARFHVRSRARMRVLDAAELFVSRLTTSLEPDELLVEIEVPPLTPRTESAFVEHARLHGDFALAGAAAVISLAADGTCGRAALSLCAVGPTPIRVPEAEQALSGAPLTDERIRTAAELAGDAVDTPVSDRRFRRALTVEIARRTLHLAASRVGEPA
jgi:carbon-monoxide dehydrogenase medium subunit